MLILHNARIYTLDAGAPVVTALALDHGHVVAAGSDAQILALARPADEKVDLQGKTVWPGLTDAHLHLEHFTNFLNAVDCETDTREECLRRVEERARIAPDGAWVTGHGWNQNVWEGGFGTAEDLDRVCHGHPVYLTSKSVHSAWANSQALQAAGIGANTPDPQGGVIGRDSSGKPNGILFETAMDLVSNVVPVISEEQLAERFATAQQELWKVGLTSVHDFDGRRMFSALQILAQQDRLKLRVTKSIPMELLEHAAAMGLRSGFGGKYLRIGSVKLFADGALGPRTAAMIAPYEGESTYTGIGLMDAEHIYELGMVAASSGLSLATHAIGDLANHEVLNAYEQMRHYEDEHRLPHLRHRIEHVQILHPDDYDRLARLSVVASMQPLHATSDIFIAEKHWGKRSAGAYAWRTLLTRGTAMAFGSDAPVESPNPFWGLHAAVTRCRIDGTPGKDGWYPEQRLTLHEALAGYTLGPAFAAGQEKRLGKLAVGYYADLIVLSEDPFDLPSQDLYQVLPERTMVGGEWVWQA